MSWRNRDEAALHLIMTFFGLAAVVAAILLGLSVPARADIGYLQPSRMKLVPGEGECFAFVEITDRVGWYQAEETLETLHGPLVVRYVTHGGQDTLDEFEVLSLPPLVKATPDKGDLDPDRETLVCLSLDVGM